MSAYSNYNVFDRQKYRNFINDFPNITFARFGSKWTSSFTETMNLSVVLKGSMKKYIATLQHNQMYANRSADVLNSLLL